MNKIKSAIQAMFSVAVAATIVSAKAEYKFSVITNSATGAKVTSYLYPDGSDVATMSVVSNVIDSAIETVPIGKKADKLSTGPQLIHMKINGYGHAYRAWQGGAWVTDDGTDLEPDGKYHMGALQWSGVWTNGWSFLLECDISPESNTYPLDRQSARAWYLYATTESGETPQLPVVRPDGVDDAISLEFNEVSAPIAATNLEFTIFVPEGATLKNPFSVALRYDGPDVPVAYESALPVCSSATPLMASGSGNPGYYSQEYASINHVHPAETKVVGESVYVRNNEVVTTSQFEANIAPQWEDQEYFIVNQLVFYKGLLYRCIESHNKNVVSGTGLDQSKFRLATVEDALSYVRVNEYSFPDSYFPITFSDSEGTAHTINDEGGIILAWPPIGSSSAHSVAMIESTTGVPFALWNLPLYGGVEMIYSNISNLLLNGIAPSSNTRLVKKPALSIGNIEALSSADVYKSAYTLPDNCFPITYTDNVLGDIMIATRSGISTSNDNIRVYLVDTEAYKEGGWGTFAVFNKTTLKYISSDGSISNLKFNNVSPVANTSPTLEANALTVCDTLVATEEQLANYLPLTGGSISINGSVRAISSEPGGDWTQMSGQGLSSGDYEGSPTRYFWMPSETGTLALLQNLADDFSTSETYAVNDLCVYLGNLYRCTNAVTTAGAWTYSTNWELATVNDVFVATKDYVRQQVDTDSPLVARSFTTTGTNIGDATGTTIYFRTRYFGMENGDRLKSFTVRTRSASQTVYPSLRIRLRRYADNAILAYSDAQEFPGTGNVDVTFTFPVSIAIPNKDNYYYIEFVTAESSSATAQSAGLRCYSYASANVDLYFQLTTIVPVMTAQFYSFASNLATLDSPAFTGTPTAPTPSSGDNSTNIATTAFVQAGLAGKLGNTGNQMLNGNLVVGATGQDSYIEVRNTDIVSTPVSRLYGNRITVTRDVLTGTETHTYSFPENDGRFALLSQIYDAVTNIAPAWVSGTSYAENVLVSYNGVVYQNTSGTTIQSATTPATVGSGWTAKKVSELFLPLTGGEMTGGLKFKAPNAFLGDWEILNNAYYGFCLYNIVDNAIIKFPSSSINSKSTLALLENIAPAFLTSATYAVNDLCIYNDTLYRCTTDITSPENWNASHWAVATVQDVLSRIAYDTRLMECKLPDDCFPITYSSGGTNYTIKSNGELFFSDFGSVVERGMYNIDTGYNICGFYQDTGKFASGDNSLKFNNISPTSGTWPVLTNETAVVVRNIVVAQDSDVLKKSGDQAMTGTLKINSWDQIQLASGQTLTEYIGQVCSNIVNSVSQ